jgi:dihydrofolate reductase
MQIRTRMCTSIDGYIATPDGLPAQLADPGWDPGAYGFVEFQASCDAVLMGRTTFEPALGADQWPWTGVDVFVLGSRRPAGTPDHVVVEADPTRLLGQVRAANRGGDVHLVGGPRTIETFRNLGALDELGLIVLPLLLGGGMQLTPAVSSETGLQLTSERALPSGAVEILYACAGPD